jgi:hypothetical protein
LRDARCDEDEDEDGAERVERGGGTR